MIRTALLILALSVLIGLGQAHAKDEPLDRINVKLTDPSKPAYVELSLVNGGITVTGYDGKEVIVEAKTRTRKLSNDDRDKKRKGMFHIPVTSAELSVEEKDNHVEIDVQSMKNRVDLEIKVPVNTSLSVHAVHDGEIVINNVNGEIEAESVHGGIKLVDVSGSVAASTTHGDIKANMKQINPDKPMSFNTFHGDVDVVFPATLKANVKIKTTQGDVYSDFEITKTEKPDMLTTDKDKDEDGKYRVVIEHGFYGIIAGGGPEFSFKTYHGDILIRKAK